METGQNVHENPAVRERLLTEALRLFTSKGFSATSVREIVESAGVTKPVLYYYFGSKEGLYLEIMGGISQTFEQKVMELQRQGNQTVGPLVKDTSGTLISEDMGLLVTNGKPVEYYTFQYSSLARAGTWDQHWEMDNLRQGNFPLVILNKGEIVEQVEKQTYSGDQAQ